MRARSSSSEGCWPPGVEWGFPPLKGRPLPGGQTCFRASRRSSDMRPCHQTTRPAPVQAHTSGACPRPSGDRVGRARSRPRMPRGRAGRRSAPAGAPSAPMTAPGRRRPLDQPLDHRRRRDQIPQPRQSIISPSIPWRIARHMFSSISRPEKRIGEPSPVVVVECGTGRCSPRSARARANNSPRDASARRRSAARPSRTSGAGERSTRAAWASTTVPVAGQAVDETRVALPCPKRLMDAAAGKRAGEDLGADGMKAGVAIVEEGGVGGHREQRRQEPRKWSQTAIARSVSRTPTWTWRLQVLFRCATSRSSCSAGCSAGCR